ncbi:MAG TPA: WD40 repeat domain-containing serine/threonine protein kinase, partial [Gemmata sp.]|nr:WD40 repeat domain-containing serine/threonine protein kinase [Gemmata sp.]
MTVTDSGVMDQVVGELLAVPEEERPAILSRVQREHPEWLPHIQEMLLLATKLSPHVSTPVQALCGKFAPGDRVGAFVITRLIGKGGMGEVYEAEQDILCRHVALKVIRAGFSTQEARGRFLREQLVLARLHQTNIVPIYFAGEHGPIQYCAMQYIGGAPLHRVISDVYTRKTLTNGKDPTPPLGECVASIVSAPNAVSPPTPTLDLSQISLPPSYFVSVAKVMIQAAEAVQHGHNHGICHRDLKPSNLIVDRDESCWVIDYGLAAYLGTAKASEAPAVDGPTDVRTAGPLGTPRYMAPEQFDGKVDARSDVWGLGVTLYELLALRPAFGGSSWNETQDLVTRTEPVPLRSLVRTIPRGLVAICRKATAKAPDDRYQTPGELAADLQRWLQWEPTRARPSWATLRPLRLWAWRNKAWALTAAAVFVALLCGIGFEAALAEKNKTESERLKQQVELEKQQVRALAVVKLQSRRLGERFSGWSSESIRELETLRQDRPGDDLRDQMTATLIGLDAKEALSRDLPHGASGVVFDAKGERILLGGTRRGPAYIRDNRPLAEFTPGLHVGEGPVAFRPDGTPIQVLEPTEKRPSLLLCDPTKPDPLAEIPLALTGKWQITTALSPDGTRLAASIGYDEWKLGKTLVWKLPGGVKGKLDPVHEWPVAATALAFSPDNGCLAMGTSGGTVSVRTLGDGKEVATIPESALVVESLAFGRNFWIGDGVPKPDTPITAKWLLAVGSKGGRLSVWKLHPQERVNQFRGSSHEVSGIAFSADGAMLASVGRTNPFLWDVATGRMLLKLQFRHVFTGVAFSPDCRRIVTTSIPVFGPNDRGGIVVSDLDDARGIRSYRGLNAPIEKVWLSPSKRYVAALTDDWQFGLWETATGRLLHVLNAPDGMTADNSAVVFGKDETDVLYSSGSRAVRWEVATGKRLNAWKLPFSGLVDQLALLPDGRWLLFRAEKEPQQWVCRGRILKPDDTFTDLYSLTDFPRHVRHADLSSDGRLLVVNGVTKIGRDAKLYDGATGKELTIAGMPPIGPDDELWINRSGNRIVLEQSINRSTRMTIIEIPGGKTLGLHTHSTHLFDDSITLHVEAANGRSVYRVGSDTVLLR